MIEFDNIHCELAHILDKAKTILEEKAKFNTSASKVWMGTTDYFRLKAIIGGMRSNVWVPGLIKAVQLDMEKSLCVGVPAHLMEFALGIAKNGDLPPHIKIEVATACREKNIAVAQTGPRSYCFFRLKDKAEVKRRGLVKAECQIIKPLEGDTR